MTTTHTTRLDQCPPGLVHVAAHGDCPGGLAYKHEDLTVVAIGDTQYFFLLPFETPDFEGVPLTWVPTSVAEESSDPRVVAYTKEH